MYRIILTALLAYVYAEEVLPYILINTTCSNHSMCKMCLGPIYQASRAVLGTQVTCTYTCKVEAWHKVSYEDLYNALMDMTCTCAQPCVVDHVI